MRLRDVELGDVCAYVRMRCNPVMMAGLSGPLSREGIEDIHRRQEPCHRIDKTNAWPAEIAAEFGTEDRQFAYRVTRAWLHALRDRLPVQVAADEPYRGRGVRGRR